MYQEFYAHSTLLSLPLVAMVLFMGTFGVVVLRTFSRRRRDEGRERHLAQLPLDDDAPPGGEGEGHVRTDV